MLSLGNVFSGEEVHEFVSRVRRFLGLKDTAPLAFTAAPNTDGLPGLVGSEQGEPGGLAATAGQRLVAQSAPPTAGHDEAGPLPDQVGEGLPVRGLDHGAGRDPQDQVGPLGAIAFLALARLSVAGLAVRGV